MLQKHIVGLKIANANTQLLSHPSGNTSYIWLCFNHRQYICGVAVGIRPKYQELDGRGTKRSPTTWNAYDYICICFNNRQYMWSRGGTWQLVQSRIPRDSRPYLNNSICELCQKPFTLLISRQSPQTCAISATYVWTCAEANLIGESAANMICSF